MVPQPVERHANSEAVAMARQVLKSQYLYLIQGGSQRRCQGLPCKHSLSWQ